MVLTLTKIFPGCIIRMYIGKVEGVENLPKGPFIFAPNHASFADDFIAPFTLGTKANRMFHMFVNSRFYDNFSFRKFLDSYQCIKVDVGKDVKDEKQRKKTNEAAMKKARQYLKKGDIIGIFPEGRRSKDGKLRKAKTGIARLALEAKVPIVPVGIKGSYDIMPKGAKFPRFKKADIKIGNPIYLDMYHGKEKDYKIWERATRMVMKAIARLIDQEYSH
jgi:1-acyl-sn-glycerol-3-phosphate acyltransferase